MPLNKNLTSYLLGAKPGTNFTAYFILSLKSFATTVPLTFLLPVKFSFTHPMYRKT